GLGRVLEAAEKHGYIVCVTADHGNADQMLEMNKGKEVARTAHSLNPVPFIIWDKDEKHTLKEGDFGLANVAPTIVKLMDLEAPSCWEPSMV
ncbi:MAG: sulfatase-like hydrolase/transferase, partial [Eubacteriales bacterium]